jgi:hypothetical protein
MFEQLKRVRSSTKISMANPRKCIFHTTFCTFTKNVLSCASEPPTQVKAQSKTFQYLRNYIIQIPSLTFRIPDLTFKPQACLSKPKLDFWTPSIQDLIARFYLERVSGKLYICTTERSWDLGAGLPDFSCYHIPKRDKIYQNGNKYTKTGINIPKRE